MGGTVLVMFASGNWRWSLERVVEGLLLYCTVGFKLGSYYDYTLFNLFLLGLTLMTHLLPAAQRWSLTLDWT